MSFGNELLPTSFPYLIAKSRLLREKVTFLGKTLINHEYSIFIVVQYISYCLVLKKPELVMH